MKPSFDFVSIMELFKLTEEDCNQPIRDFHLNKIAMYYCSKWRWLPCHLGMERIVAKDISCTSAAEEERRFHFFNEWKERRGSEATYKNLICALLSIDCREDAESICKLLQASLSKTS